MSTETSREQAEAGPRGGDYLLEHMVRMVDETGMQIGITLYVGGLVVSGLLVSGDAFLEGCSEYFESARGPAEARQALSQFVRRTHHGQPGGGGDQDDGVLDHEEVTEHTGYVHLREARVFEARGPVTQEGTWWRGRIDRIDGFHFGVLRGGS